MINPNTDRRSPGRPRRRFDMLELRRLHDGGLSLRNIARRTGMGYGTVRRALRQGQHAAAGSNLSAGLTFSPGQSSNPAPTA
jgi:hypothetical protein